VEQARLWSEGMDQEPNYRALSLRLSTAPAPFIPSEFPRRPLLGSSVNRANLPLLNASPLRMI